MEEEEEEEEESLLANRCGIRGIKLVKYNSAPTSVLFLIQTYFSRRTRPDTKPKARVRQIAAKTQTPQSFTSAKAL